MSLSARRAWIEILASRLVEMSDAVALRKESVDRNRVCTTTITICTAVALRKESVDRNETLIILPKQLNRRRSPQGERG